VLALPLTASLPDQPPLAVQLVALVEDQLSMADEPLLMLVGLALRLTVGLATVAAVTLIVNAGSDAEAVPSLTLITMLGSVPTSALPGVPPSKPVTVLNVAHAGLFVIENDSVAPLGPLAEGWKE
jgi:hypothetical protein